MASETNDARAAARKRVEERRGFFPHLLIYLVVNAGLILIWVYSGPDSFFWPAIVLIAWGIGVLMHAWNAFFAKPVTESDVDRELERSGDITERHKTD